MAVKPQILAISDNADILIGLALTGALTKMACSPDELCRVMEEISEDIVLVIVTSGLAARSADILGQYRERSHYPLVTVIPEPSDIVI